MRSLGKSTLAWKLDSNDEKWLLVPVSCISDHIWSIFSYQEPSSHPWGLYAIYIASFQTPAFIIDGLLLYSLHRACLGEPLITYRTLMSMFAGWLLFTKTIKLIPHFLRHPTDLRFLPVSLIFGYLHGFINIYALMTLHVVRLPNLLTFIMRSWSSQSRLHGTVVQSMPVTPPNSQCSLFWRQQRLGLGELRV